MTELEPTICFPQKGMRVALYSRVSTLNHGQDPEMQLRELRQYATARDWTIAREYVDRGISGSVESRPELNKLMADAHRRRFEIVLCWKIDRFGRSLKHLVNAIADQPSLPHQRPQLATKPCVVDDPASRMPSNSFGLVGCHPPSGITIRYIGDIGASLADDIHPADMSAPTNRIIST